MTGERYRGRLLEIRPAPCRNHGHDTPMTATASPMLQHPMLEHRHTTIDGNYLPGDIGCVIARQK